MRQNNLGASEMRALAKKIQEEIPGLGFAVLIFEFNKPGMSNYISNANREDMVTVLEEAAQKLKTGRDFPTPEKN